MAEVFHTLVNLTITLNLEIMKLGLQLLRDDILSVDPQ